jgi:hypothetical protein
MITVQPTERQIKETIAASGKTTVKDMVNYGMSKFPGAGKATITAYAKELKASM